MKRTFLALLCGAALLGGGCAASWNDRRYWNVDGRIDSAYQFASLERERLIKSPDDLKWRAWDSLVQALLMTKVLAATARLAGDSDALEVADKNVTEMMSVAEGLLAPPTSK